MSSDEAVLDSPVETGPKKRQRGRPRKETPQHATIITDVPNPPRLKYYSDSASPNQRTASGLKWWSELSDPCKELIDVTIYRDWPTLNDPTEEGEYKYIDKLLGTQPLKNDQDFIDRWGAGDYHAYVNVTPLGGTRRTIMMLFVKGSHDFKTYLPTDQRIDNPVENLSLTDPGNASYVAWLRSTGKITGNEPTKQETQEMAATAEVVGKVLDQNTALLGRLMDERDREPATPPSDPPPSAEEKLNESLSLLEKLQSFTNGKPTSDPLAMMTAVIEAAKMLSQSNSPQALTPFMDRIAALEEKLRATEAEMLRGQLTEIKDQLRALKEAPPPSNVLLPDGSNISSIIEQAVEKFIESKPEHNPWLDFAKSIAPSVMPLIGGIAQRLMAPSPPPQFPMPPATYTAGAQPPQQAQLPAPAQSQATPQAQPAGGAYTTGNGPLDHLLMMIQVPLADHLRDGDSGSDFADYFIADFGIDTHAQLATFGPDAIINILYGYPPLGPILKPLKRETVVKFVDEFVKYKPSEVPAGGAA